MKRSKRITAILLGLMTLILLLPARALGMGALNTEQEASLTISSQDGDIPLVGQRFDLYLVAEPDENGQLTATEQFRNFDLNIDGTDEDGWKALASTLEGYVLRDGLAPAAGAATDEQGLAAFQLPCGLYLITTGLHTQNGLIYETAPCLTMVPAFDSDSGEWLYEVTVQPKFESVPEERPETETLKVLKVWEDDGNKDNRPRKITIQLLRDGEVYDTVTLNAENNWRYDWTDLESRHKWNVTEQEQEGYSVKITREGITFVVTNTYKTPSNPPVNPPSKPPKLPQTGQYWWPVPVLLASGLLLVAVGLVRRRGGADHER